ncbi:hypothetical protein [Nocardiopsis alborubida]|uniref:Uncharacterized protein n=2 Tax=Nocardiopsis TaxID=2013 RepID=A0A7X6MA35_9ACTN|nr:hypothetical protein [Nocardiopsis alborubida]NKY97184.1 hypothetical protein [Nocardiopsis alborubida]QOP59266.1 hypothetical protein [Nocardiopsis sp.]
MVNDDHGFAVMYRLRLKGRGGAERIAAAVGSDPASVGAALEDLAERGLALYREGRISGWLLTPEGRLECERRVGRYRASLDTDVVAKLYDDDFLGLNQEFKALCARSQGPAHDHGDTLRRLESVHGGASRLLRQFAVHLTWFPVAYTSRFDTALERFREGDRAALVQPFTDSYHDVWMELHEDLLLVLARRREDED